jgi:uncharacterized protein (DUF1499 family)
VLAAVALALGLGCGAGEALAGIGYRLHWWGVSGGVRTMQWSAMAAIGALVLAVVAVIAAHRDGRPRVIGVAWLALAAGAATAGPPVYFARLATQLPGIHDISTDLEDPPRFVAIVPLRQGAPNGLERSAKVAEQQRAGYPDIAPMRLELPPARTFDLADRAARRMGWDIIALVPEQGRIEATATTLLFGFKDDVVIRITPDAAGGSRVDVRSVSRIGQSDIGTNARRIRAFMKELRAQQRDG